MDPLELERLFFDLESDRVERKASFASGKIDEAICAFANDLPDHRRPGYVFIGVNDDGTCANQPVTEGLLLRLAEFGRANILPFPVINVQKHVFDGCEVAVVEVLPSYFPPIRLRGRIIVRLGPRLAVASQEEERRLSEKRRYADLPYDIHPFENTTLDDLDLIRFQREYLPAAVPADLLEENTRSVESQLQSLRFTGGDGVPTVLGLLTVGKDPREYISGAYVQFLRIDGTELTDPIKDEKEIGGPLLDILRRVDEVMETNITTAVEIMGSPAEVRSHDYPIESLRQLTRNAILHRTYEGTNAPVRLTWFNDRIEIQNPGGPYGQVTRENFGQPGITDYRNPNLAEVMKNLGYVQRFGMGIQLARNELENNGNPKLEYTIEDAHVLATLRPAQ